MDTVSLIVVTTIAGSLVLLFGLIFQTLRSATETKPPRTGSFRRSKEEERASNDVAYHAPTRKAQAAAALSHLRR